MKGGAHENKYNIPSYKEPQKEKGKESYNEPLNMEPINAPNYYKEPKNNPMIPHEQKRIYNENKPKEQQNQNQILNLQLYQPPRPKPANTQTSHPSVYYPNFVPNPYDPTSYARYMQNIQQPIIKEYNINIGGVSGSHVMTSLLFEDSLPIRNVSWSFTSLGERLTMYEAIRSVLFPQGDGKDVPIDDNTYNLLSHLKIMDMNPYNASNCSKNPYRGLAFGFLLYRSCYPIRHNIQNSSAICSSNSTGINIRIYRMTEGAYMVNRQNITKASDYDLWRDVAFYNFIKEHIIKKKISPNFPFVYGYNITVNSNINFDEIKIIQGPRSTDVSPLGPSNQNNSTFGNMYQNNKTLPPNKPIPIKNSNVDVNPGTTIIHEYPMAPGYPVVAGYPVASGYPGVHEYSHGHSKPGCASNPEAINPRNRMCRDPITGLVTHTINNQPTKESQKILLNKYTGKALVCLTEAANYNILGWAKKEYRTNGNIKTMINSGYHTKTVWESVLFQLMAALYVMQIKGIIIKDFKLDRNVFIKDISTGGNVTHYWKYKIRGIEYFIPNYGYLVLIDSNYRDFDQSQICEDETEPGHVRKLDGSFLDSCTLQIDDCIKKSFETFRSTIDSNVFDQDFINDNGVKPPEDILRLFDNIKNSADAKPTIDISYYIRHFMTMFMNNRVGTPLTSIEINNVKRGSVKEFNKGQMVVMPDIDGTDTFVIYVETKKNNVARIITKDKLDPSIANIIEKDVPITSLNEYSVVEPIKQNFKMNESNLNDESLLETYNIE